MGNLKTLKPFSKDHQPDREKLRKPKTKTIVKRRIKEIATWDKVEAIVEQNIIELLSDKNKKIKMEATKAFSEFIKPKKRENVNEFKGNLVLKIVGLEEGDF